MTKQIKCPFVNGPGDRGSIPGRDSNMVFDDALLNTQHYQVRIKSKVEQSREWKGRQLYLLNRSDFMFLMFNNDHLVTCK